MSNNSLEINITSLEDFKQKLWVDSLDTTNINLPKPFSLTQEELNKMKWDFEKMWDDDKVKRIQEIILAKQQVLNKSKEERGSAYTLDRIQSDIENKWISIDVIKWILESIKDAPKEHRSFIIWGIFSSLNKVWIKIASIDSSWRLRLTEGKQSITNDLKIASKQEASSYEELINNYLKTEDFMLGLLYRTSKIEEFKATNPKDFSTSSYAQYLADKYGIHIREHAQAWDEIVWNINNLKIQNASQLENEKQKISRNVSNQADKEFLLAYFDDIYFRNKQTLKQSHVTEFYAHKEKIDTTILSELGKLDKNTKFALWLKNENSLEELKTEIRHNPMSLLEKWFSRDNIALMIFAWWIIGLLGKIFWLPFLKTAAIGWLLVWAGNVAWFENIWKWIKNKWNKKSETGTSPEAQNSYYGKINFNSEGDSAKQLQLNTTWWELSKNKDFLSAPTSILNIFSQTPKKSFDEIKTTLSWCWIVLSEENKDYYERIFAEILEQRKNAWIWAPLETETIGGYLDRTSVVNSTSTAAVVWWVKTETMSEENIPLYQTTFTYKIKEGKTYLIWENDEYLIQNNTINEAGKEVLKKYEKLGVLNEILQIWLPHAEQTVSSLLFKWMRTGTSVIPESIKNITTIFEKLFIKVQKWDNIDADINTIWQEIEKAENATSIIWSSDMSKVKQFFYDTYDNKDQKLLKIYNTMRYSGWSGNSEWVKNQVAEHLLHQESFKNIDDILKNPQTFEYIKNHNSSELEKILGTDITKEILSAYSKIKIKQEKQREEYAKIVTRINQERKAKNEPEIDLNGYIELNTEISIIELLKHSLIRKQIFEMTSRGDEKSSYTWFYANVIGLAQNKWNDWAVISDENIDIAIDISSTIAIAAVSMWVWAIAARWALAAARWWANATRLSTLVDKWWKAWKVAWFAWSSTVEWVAFYQGYNSMNNIIYGNNVFENAGNVKEMAKTVAFMWVLRGLWEVMSYANWAKWLHGWISKTDAAFKFIWKMSDKVPAGVLKNTGEILIKWWIVSGSSVGLDYVFEWEADWTWEEYMQAVMLVWVMKWVWKITFKKGANWEVRANTQASPETNWFFQKIGEKVSNKLANAPEQIKQNLKKTIIEMLKAGSIWWTTFAWVGGWINLLQWEEFTENIIQNFLTWFTAWVAVKVVFIWLNGLKHVFSIGKDGLLKWSGATASKLPNDWKKIALWSGIAYWWYEVYSFLSND